MTKSSPLVMPSGVATSAIVFGTVVRDLSPVLGMTT